VQRKRHDKKSIRSVQNDMKSCKAASSRIHVIANKNGWALKREGTKRASLVVNTKVDAISRGTRLLNTKSARNLIIHKKDGTIDSWRSSRKTPRR